MKLPLQVVVDSNTYSKNNKVNGLQVSAAF